MRILIATDAWRPQVNGVVSTLERMTQAAGEFGAKFDFLTPQGMWTAPMPTYPDIRLAIPRSAGSAGCIEEAGPGPYPHRDRRSDRLADATRLPQAQARFHHQLSHALSRIHQGAHRRSRAPHLCGPALFPCAVARRSWRRRACIGDRPHPARLSRVRLWTRGVNHALFRPRAEPACSICRDRSSSRSAGWRSKRTSRRCSTSTCPVRPSSSATAPRAPRSSAAIPHAHFLGALAGRAARAGLRQRRRLRLSVAHRHVRHRDDRSAGERTAGRGLSGPRPDRRRRPGGGRPGRRPARGLHAGADHSARSGARIFPPLHLERMRAAVSRKCRIEPPRPHSRSRQASSARQQRLRAPNPFHTERAQANRAAEAPRTAPGQIRRSFHDSHSCLDRPPRAGRRVRADRESRSELASRAHADDDDGQGPLARAEAELRPDRGRRRRLRRNPGDRRASERGPEDGLVEGRHRRAPAASRRHEQCDAQGECHERADRRGRAVRGDGRRTGARTLSGGWSSLMRRR